MRARLRHVLAARPATGSGFGQDAGLNRACQGSVMKSEWREWEREMTSDSSSGSVSPSDAFSSHLAWLKEMRQEYDNSMRSSEHGTDFDFAVGSVPAYYPTYRSLLDLSLDDDNHHPGENQNMELDFSEPIYRSLPSNDNADAPPAEETNRGTWVAQVRPPLIKRQRGFGAGL